MAHLVTVASSTPLHTTGSSNLVTTVIPTPIGKDTRDHGLKNVGSINAHCRPGKSFVGAISSTDTSKGPTATPPVRPPPVPEATDSSERDAHPARGSVIPPVTPGYAPFAPHGPKGGKGTPTVVIRTPVIDFAAPPREPTSPASSAVTIWHTLAGLTVIRTGHFTPIPVR